MPLESTRYLWLLLHLQTFVKLLLYNSLYLWHYYCFVSFYQCSYRLQLVSQKSLKYFLLTTWKLSTQPLGIGVYVCALHWVQNHTPSGSSVSPTQTKWNHSWGQSGPSQATSLHMQSLCADKKYHHHHHRQHRWSEGHEVLQWAERGVTWLLVES